jgi:hypothetical protein
MVVILGLALILLVCYLTDRRARSRRARQRAAADPLAQALPPREIRKLDAHLKKVARRELRRLERDVKRYLAGTAGYVVTIQTSPGGIALELSDGRLLTLVGVNPQIRQLLIRRATDDLLRPTHLHRVVWTYRLRLRGRAGTDIDVDARNIALAR